MSNHPKSVLILYGSETGTGEDVAFKIFHILSSSSSTSVKTVRISSIDDYNIESLPNESFILFIISTTGDGEVPSSMKYFWKFLLQRSLPKNSLDNLAYGIFGLGDSGYDKYNAAARKLNSRLKQLGAEEFVSLGLGDDQSPLGYLGTLDPWIESLTQRLQISFEKDRPLQLPSQYFLLITPQEPAIRRERPPQSFPKPQGGLQLTDITQATITENVRLSRREWSQGLFHLTLTLPPSQQPLYRAGDVLVVYPPNPTEIVDLALSFFSGTLQTIQVASASGALGATEKIVLEPFTELEIRKVATQTSFSRKNRLPSGLTCSLRDLFTLHLDITAVPQRSYFEQLSFYATNPEEAEKLLELSSGEGVDLYQQYCAKERRGYIEILSEFKSCHGIPLERLIELIPPLSPRYYSIASSGLGNPSEVQLCIALVEFLTPLKRKRYGLCSKYLSELSVGSQVTCCIRKGSFPTPTPSDPLVLIGPGTGLAPMRAFIHERYPEFSELTSTLRHGDLPPPPPSPPPSTEGVAVTTRTRAGETVLFYGCRSEEDDYLYKEEWHALSTYSSQHNLPVTIKVAFSRKGTNSGRYVTHDLRDQGALLWHLLQQVHPSPYLPRLLPCPR
jgi:sulfite reductase alpha subunit-like flavoprotein